MQRIKKAYAENGDLKIIPDTPPLDGSENWEQGRGYYFELDNDPNTGDPLALDIDREQDNYFKNVISKNIKHWQENAYPNWFEDIEYSKNAIVKYEDVLYASKVDNNTALPTNATNWTIYDPSSLDSKFVKTTGNETIAGVKTFSSRPIVPTPTTNTQAVNKTYVDTRIPTGVILMWSGSIATIPTGWVLCNGANGTPDLRNRFVIGAGSTYGVGATGGSKDAVVVAHTHTGSTSSNGSHTHTYNNGMSPDYAEPYNGGEGHDFNMNQQKSTNSAGAHTHSLTINSTGSSGTNANLPPYYALAFIMKL